MPATISVPRSKITSVLNQTAIDWRWGGTDCHYNVFPINNIKGWTTDQRAILILARLVWVFMVPSL